MKRKLINPAATEFLYEAQKFSQAVQVGDTLWISGQVGFNADGIPDDFTEQARLAFINLKGVLEHAGGDLADIVELTIYITDMANSEGLTIARNEFISKNYPSVTLIGISALALPQLKVEIKATAVLDSSELA